MYYDENIQNELMHHGILGMKWGVRKYQNPDGSYTSAGKRRYLDSQSNDQQRAKASERWDKAAAKQTNKVAAKQARLQEKKQWSEKKKTKLEGIASRERALETARDTFTTKYDIAGSIYSKYAINKAAKYVVDKNMSYEDARLLANRRTKQTAAVVAGVSTLLLVNALRR